MRPCAAGKRCFGRLTSPRNDVCLHFTSNLDPHVSSSIASKGMTTASWGPISRLGSKETVFSANRSYSSCFSFSLFSSPENSSYLEVRPWGEGYDLMTFTHTERQTLTHNKFPYCNSAKPAPPFDRFACVMKAAMFSRKPSATTAQSSAANFLPFTDKRRKQYLLQSSLRKTHRLTHISINRSLWRFDPHSKV